MRKMYSKGQIEEIVEEHVFEDINVEEVNAANIFASDEIEFSDEDGDFGTNAKAKIQALIPEVSQEQADWNQTDDTKVDYIKNKPDLSNYVTDSELAAYHDSTKQDVISDLDTIRSGASAGATAVQPSALSNYATQTDLQQGLATKETVGVAYTKAESNALLANKLDATKCTLQTTAPTSAISDGGVHIVYLASEPSTKYSGYIYLIAE